MSASKHGMSMADSVEKRAELTESDKEEAVVAII